VELDVQLKTGELVVFHDLYTSEFINDMTLGELEF
jgi:glycerophosphoryl diester phosphodiesterase